MSAHPCQLPDAELLQQCRVETYRASGPGGQKRNKTSSAVRVTHVPSGRSATGTESRSQHENRARALHRLRLELAMHLRLPFDGTLPKWWRDVTDSHGRLVIGPRSERYAPAIAIMLDALEQYGGSVADAAEAMGASTAGLVAMLAAEPHVWARTQDIRRQHGHRLLSNPR